MQKAVACRWHRIHLQLRMHLLRGLHNRDEKHLPQLPGRIGVKTKTEEELIIRQFKSSIPKSIQSAKIRKIRGKDFKITKLPIYPIFPLAQRSNVRQMMPAMPAIQAKRPIQGLHATLGVIEFPVKIF